MATPLDLEEQEQLDQIKHFWKTWGNLISWVLIAILGSYAAWNGYQYWERSQAAKASALYDEVERAVSSGDVSRVERSFADMKDKFGSTQFAQQSALLAAKTLQAQGKTDAARDALSWVANGASDKAYRDIARMRLAALHLDAKAYDEALKQLGGEFTPAMMGLAADLRGDVLQAKGQNAEAIVAYQQAWQKLADTPDYRRLVQAKLNALGIDPDAATVSETPK
ncbi:MAG: tetratricopeptide repeat protein [Limnohabitans sp.]|jgi:predicted negative regulator of RcsB-dependent stress response|uniref:YfgM family protein n=1 Tax=Limnohabitans sp. TaxID=1907725 RepID=UPI001B6F21A1|nr:tetratricopeptide repeat protein [Limnohabitans sp.]MBP6220236.1 tetratricopeptide repeat protein [Limnohabitans sp.]MBP6244424.1 tetratricopeptide repeat protein [Limnohabitans sp.]